MFNYTIIEIRLTCLKASSDLKSTMSEDEKEFIYLRYGGMGLELKSDNII